LTASDCFRSGDSSGWAPVLTSTIARRSCASMPPAQTCMPLQSGPRCRISRDWRNATCRRDCKSPLIFNIEKMEHMYIKPLRQLILFEPCMIRSVCVSWNRQMGSFLLEPVVQPLPAKFGPSQCSPRHQESLQLVGAGCRPRAVIQRLDLIHVPAQR